MELVKKVGKRSDNSSQYISCFCRKAIAALRETTSKGLATNIWQYSKLGNQMMLQCTTHPISTPPLLCAYSSRHSCYFHFSTGFTSEPIGARPGCGCGPSFPRICWPINVHSQKPPVPLGSRGHCIGTAFWRLQWYGNLVLPPAGAISFMPSSRVEESPLIFFVPLSPASLILLLAALFPAFYSFSSSGAFSPSQLYILCCCRSLYSSLACLVLSRFFGRRSVPVRSYFTIC